MRSTFIILSITSMFALRSFAAHIVGGDMYYDCLGNNDYRITLKVYRDCNASGPNVAWFDEPAFIGVYDVSGALLFTENVYLEFGSPVNIPPETQDPCLQAPANVCVHVGTYSFVRNLPPQAGGYDIVYVRCCRNATIANIPTPNDYGATYTTHIPESGCNSSPRFTDFPPIVICVNAPINFDHSATDPDGDQLVYSLCTPYSGASSLDPQPSPELFLSPFVNVPWLNPFNATNPMDASPVVALDAQTGLLTGTPTRTGQFVVGVCVQEFRNGVFVGETKRDFQFNVTLCSTDVEAKIPVVDTIGAGTSGTAGVFMYQCQGFFVQFINQSRNGAFYRWDFGDLTTIADTSLQFQPSYTYPDSGVYKVTLIVNPGFNCADTTAVLVKIYPTFTADFDFVSGCADAPVTFTDKTATSYGTVNFWSWNFGDGITASAQNTSHLYQQGGNFAVTLTARSDKGCSDTQTKTVVVHPMPQADFSFSPVCLNTPVTFNDLTTVTSGSITGRSWLFNNNPINSTSTFTQTFNNLNTFDVTLIANSNQGCSDTVTESVTVHPLPVAIVRPDTVLCIGEQVLLAASGGEAYQWQPTTGLNSAATANPISTPAATTIYVLTITDANQCVDTDSVTITVNPLPNTNAGNDTYICEGDFYQLNGTGGISFSWSPGNVLSDSTLSNPTASIADTTTFTLTSFNVFGCRNIDSVTIAVQHPIGMTVSPAQDLCETTSVTLSATGGIYYLWSPDDGLTDNTLPDYTVAPSASTIYTVIVSNDCFADTGSVDVTIRPLPAAYAGIDDSMIRDEFVFLNGSANGITNLWTPSAGLEDSTSLTTRASPFNTTNYRLTAVSEYGCVKTDTVTIFVEVVNLLVVPTAFSPNNDGTNDLFRILRVLNVQQLLDFKVFNRWGQLLFETTDLNQGWDGTYNGVTQELGVYAYVIRVLNRDGEKIVKGGNVTLVK